MVAGREVQEASHCTEMTSRSALPGTDRRSGGACKSKRQADAAGVRAKSSTAPGLYVKIEIVKLRDENNCSKSVVD